MSTKILQLFFTIVSTTKGVNILDFFLFDCYLYIYLAKNYAKKNINNNIFFKIFNLYLEKRYV
jgi:hypothetical protein